MDYGLSTVDSQFIRDIAASFQSAVVNWLVEKTFDAADVKKVGDLVAGGGVSANSELRRQLTERGQRLGYQVWFPPLALTSDNAAMIARRGAEIFRKGRRSALTLAGDPNLTIQKS